MKKVRRNKKASREKYKVNWKRHQKAPKKTITMAMVTREQRSKVSSFLYPPLFIHEEGVDGATGKAAGEEEKRRFLHLVKISHNVPHTYNDEQLNG